MVVGGTWLTIVIAVTSLPRDVPGMPMSCTGNTRYVPPLGAKEGGTGTCEACPPCDGGGFMYNLTLPRLKDPVYGYTSCYPCVPCPIGQYREAGSHPVCNLCVKSCAAVNRFESQPCGGSSPGHCGECFDRYVRLTNAAEGVCEKKPETSSTQGSTDKLPSQGSTERSPPGQSTDKAAIEINSKAEASVNIDGGTVVGSLAAIIAIVTVSVIGLAKLCGKKSQEGLGPRTETSAIENEAFIKAAPASKVTLENTSLSSQVEPDARPDVRGEIPKMVSVSEQQVLLPHGRSHRYPSHRLIPGDHITKECISYISTNIGAEENRTDLFRALHLKPSVYELEVEKWLKEKLKYADCIYNVLLRWIEMKAESTDADLAHLCSCLEDSNMMGIAKDLADMYTVLSTQPQQTGSTGSEHGHIESASVFS